MMWLISLTVTHDPLTLKHFKILQDFKFKFVTCHIITLLFCIIKKVSYIEEFNKSFLIFLLFIKTIVIRPYIFSETETLKIS